MGSKKVGIIVCIVCILLALIIFGISNIKVTPKKSTERVADTSVGVSATSVSKTEKSNNAKTETQVAEEATTVAVATEQAQAQTTPQTEKENNQGVVNEGDINLSRITAENKLSYAGAEQRSYGKVVEKTCYLSGNQIIYCLHIETVMGTAGEVVEYYCAYNVYEDISVGTELELTYKQTTTNTFAIMSVTKPDNN